jgi:hypothetical protein
MYQRGKCRSVKGGAGAPARLGGLQRGCGGGTCRMYHQMIKFGKMALGEWRGWGGEQAGRLSFVVPEMVHGKGGTVPRADGCVALSAA